MNPPEKRIKVTTKHHRDKTSQNKATRMHNTRTTAGDKNGGTDKMKVYISGPMSGIEDYNYPAFFKASRVIESHGHVAINPAKDTPPGMSWQWYMRRALQMMLDADEVWMLPGWLTSKGAKIEYRLANEVGIVTRTAPRYVIDAMDEHPWDGESA